MSLLKKIKEKQEKKPIYDTIENGLVTCTQENKDQVLNAVKQHFPQLLDDLKLLKQYGMVDGLRNIKISKELLK